jgi:hypothetical protein
MTDLVTPYMVSLYMIDQLKPIDGAAPVVTHVYPGGHMMYLRPGSRALLAEDVKSFYGDTAEKPPILRPYSSHS